MCGSALTIAVMFVPRAVCWRGSRSAAGRHPAGWGSRRAIKVEAIADGCHADSVDLSERLSELAEGTLAGKLCQAEGVRAWAPGEQDRRDIAIRPGVGCDHLPREPESGAAARARQPSAPRCNQARRPPSLAWTSGAEPGDACRLAVDEIHRAIHMPAARGAAVRPGRSGSRHPSPRSPATRPVRAAPRGYPAEHFPATSLLLTVTVHGLDRRAADLARRLQAVAGGRVTESSGGVPRYGSISTRASWPVQPWLRVEEGRSAVSTLGLP
jgi:hypothetical protein